MSDNNNILNKRDIDKKILIVTLCDNQNFGNRLQNYALQEVLKSLGCSVQTLTVKRPVKTSTKFKQPLKILMAVAGSEKYRNIIKWGKREKRGARFTSENIRSDVVIGSFQEAFEYDFGAYDYAVAGSDQIWHIWKNNPYELKYYGLTFLPQNQRIAYAGSFGFNEVPESLLQDYTEILQGYVAVSVRENTGASIVKSLTGRDAQVVLDPTLLLDRAQWERMEKKPTFVKNREYVVIYSLGDRCEEFETEIQRCLETGYEIYDLRAADKWGRELPVGPSEFLYLIHHAHQVLTDSFHATAFSIIYQKNVEAFRRPGVDMSDRIRSLVKTIGLEERLHEDGMIFSINSVEDYNEVKKHLKVEKEKSVKYLKKSLSGVTASSNS